MPTLRSEVIIRGLGYLLVALMLAGHGTAQADEDSARQASATHTTIFIVRHAEKSADSVDPPLSVAGQTRARTLAAMLRGAGVQHIFTTEMRRTRETAAPVAKGLGIVTKVLPANDLDGLVVELRRLSAGAVALVVHHSNTIPGIIGKLGGPPIATITEQDYDRLFVVTFGAEGGARLATLHYGHPSDRSGGQRALGRDGLKRQPAR
jgi:broad specificity phosphatase PhoE